MNSTDIWEDDPISMLEFNTFEALIYNFSAHNSKLWFSNYKSYVWYEKLKDMNFFQIIFGYNCFIDFSKYIIDAKLIPFPLTPYFFRKFCCPQVSTSTKVIIEEYILKNNEIDFNNERFAIKNLIEFTISYSKSRGSLYINKRLLYGCFRDLTRRLKIKLI